MVACAACATSPSGIIAHPRLGEFLVEALLRRGSPADLEMARAVAGKMADIKVEAGFVLHELPSLRAQALLARADGDGEGYVRYRARAHELGFEGHIDTAEAMN